MIPKPPRKKREAVRVMPDGREICQNTPAGRAEYGRRTLAMLKRQGGVCGLKLGHYCNLFGNILREESATFDHEDGRGMGGARRDDRIEKDGKPYNCAACAECNYIKGSRRLK